MGVFGKSAFYLAEPGIIIGYHGCEKEVRDALVSGKMEMNISNRPHEWLGYGLYFWQYNYERALDFATNPPPGKVIKEPAVLGAIITLGNCLDLIDTGEIKKLKLSFDNFKASMESKGLKLPQNINSAGAGDSDDRVLRRLDCAVIENLHRQKEGSHLMIV